MMLLLITRYFNRKEKTLSLYFYSVNYHDLVGCFHKNKKDEKGLKRYQVCLL